MSSRLRINNKDARRIWLWTNGLAEAPTGPLDVMATIRRLGFVQIDSIRNVSRAQHHILWSRNQNYREPMLNKLLAEDREIFEHFTHDASVIPMEFYGVWERQFRRLGAKVRSPGYYRNRMSDSDLESIKQRIWNEGPLSSDAFDTKIKGKKEMWSRPPHKNALDMMWYCGELATSHRIDFRKFYDLAERIIPQVYKDEIWEDPDQIHWLCKEALTRLSFGTSGEIQRFWEAMNAKEAKEWVEANFKSLVPVEIQSANGDWFEAVANADIEERLQSAPAPTARLRIINPFDPAVRDRVRLARLFGFEYRNEIFVPASRRKWGYYVYPLLEGNRFLARVELKADRKTHKLKVLNLWVEQGVKWSAARAEKLDAELLRFGKLADGCKPTWACKRSKIEA